MIILGIESSCDDSSVATYDTHTNTFHELTKTQNIHKEFGGVVPELASRNHAIDINELLNTLLSNFDLKKLDLIAFTQGPGLSGSLMTGCAFAKSLALSLKIPSIGINHIEAHMYSPLIEFKNLLFPFLSIVVSGGHTLISIIKDFNSYEIVSTTVDDALGESIDKFAKEIGLDFPYGKNLEVYASNGNEKKFTFPYPVVRSNPLNFSFSGIKTYSKKLISHCDSKTYLKDLAASYQYSVFNIIAKKTKRISEKYKLNKIAISGGVASNLRFREILKNLFSKKTTDFYFPSSRLCTDNASMIAFLGQKKYDKLSYVDTDFTPFANFN
tara:strand:+ start:267 stop:1247 length:981 start_codon:yes stop_codon:yes gene_type:complete